MDFSDLMEHSLGTRLRQHREGRGLSLADIAAQTKIKMSLLDGLERDDVSQWPAGIFRRAYVRTYASAIGFDPDAAMRAFLERHPEPVEPAEPPAPAPRGLRGVLGSALGSFRKQPSPEPTSGQHAPVVDRPPSVVPRTFDIAPRIVERQERATPPAPVVAERAEAKPKLTDAPPPAPVVPSAPAAAPAPDFAAAAAVCTELGRVEDADRLPVLMRDAAGVLGARGLIVWLWDAVVEELRPAIVHGYPAKVRSRLRGVRADADNVTAAAYRSSAAQAAGAALAVPILTASGCAGVLALELTGGEDAVAPVRAVATVFAAMLAQLSGGSQAAIDTGEVPTRLEVQSG